MLPKQHKHYSKNFSSAKIIKLARERILVITYPELKLFLTHSLELQIVGGSFGHPCFSTMEPLEAEPSCCLELRSLHAVLYSWCVRWIHRRQVSPMNEPPLYNNETRVLQLNSCRCIAHIRTWEGGVKNVNIKDELLENINWQQRQMLFKLFWNGYTNQEVTGIVLSYLASKTVGVRPSASASSSSSSISDSAVASARGSSS